MKKFVFIILAALICFAAFDAVKAQSPTPTVGKEWVKYSLKSTNLATSKPTATFLFYPDQNVNYITVQANYSSISGDSCNVKIYPSADGVNFPSASINSRLGLQWETGDGSTKVMQDSVYLAKYPVAYLKIVVDTLTGITAGTVSIYIKPHFK